MEKKMKTEIETGSNSGIIGTWVMQQPVSYILKP